MSPPANMSGLWSGTYRYDGQPVGVSFTAAITESEGEIFGTTLEPATFGPDTAQELEAEISGSRRSLSVDFQKRYDASTGIVQPPLAYTGQANGDFSEVRGTWRFAGSMQGFFGGPTGTFRMTRVASNRVTAREGTVSTLAT